MKPALALTSMLLILLAASIGQADSRLPVVFHVAVQDGARVEDGARLERELALSNHYFFGAELTFERVETRSLPEGHAVLRNIRERRQLSRYLVPRAINVFVVDQILDPVASESTRRAAALVGSAPTGRLGGAHIRVVGRVPDTYIVVSRRSPGLVLAHELGHFLGAPHHRDESNIMSYGSVRTHFNDRQIRVFRMFARRHLRRRTLRRI